MNLEKIKALIPHIPRETWEKFLLVLEYFALQCPQTTYRPLWCLCIETTKPRSPQAFVVIDRSGHVLRFYWVRPGDTDHQHSYWDQWLEKAQSLNNSFVNQKAEVAQSQREAERLARDIANREMEKSWGYDVAVTVTVNVQRLPRKNVALAQGPRWNWVVVQTRFQNQPKAHRVEQLLADQISHFQLEVEDTRAYNKLLHDFQGWIVKQVQANRLAFNIHDEQAVELVRKGK